MNVTNEQTNQPTNQQTRVIIIPPGWINNIIHAFYYDDDDNIYSLDSTFLRATAYML